GDPHELRGPAKALQVLDAAQGLEDRIVPRPVAVGAVGAEGGDGAVDQARIESPERRRVHAEPLGDAGAHVLHEDVGRRDEPTQHLEAGRLLEVDGDGALAAVPAEEAGQLAERVTLERLDLDDAGAHVGKHHGAVGSGEVRGAVDDRDALERSRQTLRHYREDVTRRVTSSRWYSVSPYSGSSPLARFM